MIELHVEGMTCGGCAASVKRAVLSVDRNAEVKVDLGEKTVRVRTGAEVSEVSTAVAAAGYPVLATRAL